MGVRGYFFNNRGIIKVTASAKQPINGSFAPRLTKVVYFKILIEYGKL
jgi:hypothetical protein